MPLTALDTMWACWDFKYYLLLLLLTAVSIIIIVLLSCNLHFFIVYVFRISLTIAHAELNLSKTVSNHPQEREMDGKEFEGHHLLSPQGREEDAVAAILYCMKNHSLFAMVTIRLDVYILWSHAPPMGPPTGYSVFNVVPGRQYCGRQFVGKRVSEWRSKVCGHV